MASFEFWGGLGVIGSSKIMISDGGHRVLLDIGLDIPSGANLFRVPVRIRPDRELADRLRVGAAPALPGIYDPAFLDDGDPLAAAVGEAANTHIFVSHPHIDHVGLAGWVRPEVPVHAHSDAVDLLEALAANGQGLPGGDPDWQRLADDEVVEVGAMTVRCIPVDHDVPGACGYLVSTPEGSIAYTGDIRFHGHHPEVSDAFVDAVRGVDVLITEGTTLSFTPPEGRPRGEEDVLAEFVDIVAAAPGLVLLSTYPRDVERVADFIEAAANLGRTIVWPTDIAGFLRALGVNASSWSDEIDLAAVHAKPGAFLIVPEADDLPALLDLPLRPGDPFIHANGEPLGEFDPRWPVFSDWLAQFGVELHKIGCWGHALPDQVHAMVERVAPKVVFPIHTFEPTRLAPPIGVRRVVAAYGTRYALDGSIR
ncbi:MAG TPA: MBL fold metallo-hydrolase [Pseudonocardiaceae bacterium]|nr:MBL fold metallo-hydrolase [Pseudonocardiaceae bacterium]